jgi:hypothetical protein
LMIRLVQFPQHLSVAPRDLSKEWEYYFDSNHPHFQ